MFDEMKKKLQATVSVVEADLGMIKTGRAKPALVERVMIEAYEGAPKMPLVELSSISALDPTTLVVQPWDLSIVKKVLAGLSQSDQHLNPILDGNVIRITLPPLTEERRRDLVKMVHQKVENGKEMLRDVRNDTKKVIDNKKDEADVSEDDIKRWLNQMQEIFEEYTGKLSDLAKNKEEELMSL